MASTLEPQVLLPGHGRPLTAGTAAALHALAEGRPRAHRRRRLQRFVPRYSGGGRYRPPPRLYTRLQWLGFMLTWLGLSPSYVVTPEVPRTSLGVIRKTNLVLAARPSPGSKLGLTGRLPGRTSPSARAGRPCPGRWGAVRLAAELGEARRA